MITPGDPTILKDTTVKKLLSEKSARALTTEDDIYVKVPSLDVKIVPSIAWEDPTEAN